MGRNQCDRADLLETGQVAAILFSGFVGLVNGVLVELVGLDAFIAPLGTMTILGGLAYGPT